MHLCVCTCVSVRCVSVSECITCTRREGGRTSETVAEVCVYVCVCVFVGLCVCDLSVCVAYEGQRDCPVMNRLVRHDMSTAAMPDHSDAL